MTVYTENMSYDATINNLQYQSPYMASTEENHPCPICTKPNQKLNVFIYTDTSGDLYVAGEDGSNFHNNYYDGMKGQPRYDQLLATRNQHICDSCTKGLLNGGAIRYRYTAPNSSKIVKVCTYEGCYKSACAKLRGLELCGPHLPCFEYGAYKKCSA